MCAPRKYIGRRGTRTRYPRALSQPRYQWAILAYPCGAPWEALQEPCRCPGGARQTYLISGLTDKCATIFFFFKTYTILIYWHVHIIIIWCEHMPIWTYAHMINMAIWWLYGHINRLKSQNKKTDFFMILAWLCRFNMHSCVIIGLLYELTSTCQVILFKSSFPGVAANYSTFGNPDV